VPAFLSIIIFSSCISDSKKIIIRPEQTIPQISDPLKEPIPEGGYQIIDYKNKGKETEIPAWVTRYFEQGITGIEALDSNHDNYVFIGSNRGYNFKALTQWAAMFSAIQDFPQLAAQRVERRLLSSASLYPDDEYGDFFEIFVKKAFDAEYPGSVRVNDFWVLQQALDSNDAPSYCFLVLMSIDKTKMKQIIAGLIAETVPELKPTRNQAAAINRVRENFFEGF
jgi:hypothetical protein